MTKRDNSLEKMIAEAEKRGKELEDLDERNRKRRSKGRKPLMDPQEKMEREVLNKRYRTNDHTTVDGADAMKLFEIRKEQMASGEDDEDDENEGNADPVLENGGVRASVKEESEYEEAVRAAEAARRIQDMKGGRIDHEGNWTDGQNLEKGDETKLTTSEIAFRTDGVQEVSADKNQTEESRPRKGRAKKSVGADALEEFRQDLYQRLRISFDGLERTLSDLQGRVSEILKAETPADISEAEVKSDGMSEFENLLSMKSPVVFDVGGTKMTFDAICVFSAPPCITVVSKIGSAKITPKPGAQLLLTYDIDGRRIENDPVTFLGTRFDLPMFGLSFVGFIRDAESDLMDVDAGVYGTPNLTGE